MKKYFVGSDIHFIAFEKNLFKHDQCEHLKARHQIVSDGDIYKVAGTEMPIHLHNKIMDHYLKGKNDLKIIPEILLYKTIK